MIDFQTWRRAELMVLVKEYNFFYFIAAITIFFARLCEPIVSPWPSLIAASFSLLVHLALRRPSFCRALSSEIISSGLIDIGLVVLIIYPFAVISLNCRTIVDDVLRSRAWWTCLVSSVFTLAAHGFAPRFVVVLVGIALIAHVLSSPNLANDQRDRFLSLIDLITVVSGMLTFFLFEYCARTQFAYVRSAHEVTLRCQSHELCRKKLLEKVFDASCVCNENALILGSSHVLDALLNRGAPLANTSEKETFLSDFVEDSVRFSAFLKSVQTSSSLAVPLQVTMRVLEEPVEVVIFGMSLVESSMFSADHRRLFLGMTVNHNQSSRVEWPQHEIDEQIATVITRCKFWQHTSKDHDDDCVKSWEKTHVLWRRVVFMSVMMMANLAVMLVCLQQGISPDWSSVLLCLGSSVAGMAFAVTDLAHFHAGIDVGKIHSRINLLLGERAMVLLLQVTCRFSIEVSILYLCLHIEEVLMKHKCYLTMHCLFSIHLGTLADMSTRTYLLLVGSLQMCSWLWFHWAVGLNKPIAFILGAMISVLSAYYLNIMHGALNKISSALRSEVSAKMELDALMLTYTKMHESIFDATCSVALGVHVVQSCSQQFKHLFGDYVGVLLLTAGYDVGSSELIHKLLQEAEVQQGAGAVAELVHVRAQQMGYTAAKQVRLTAILEPGHKPDTKFECIMVGVQIWQDQDTHNWCSGDLSDLSSQPCQIQPWFNIHDNHVRPLDTGSEIHASDSASNCVRADWARCRRGS